MAKKLGFKIENRAWNHLLVNPHPESEWIDLYWHKVKSIKKREGWDLEKSQIQDKRMGELYDDDWYCGGFTKTHYAGAECHVKVAEFLRFIATHCEKTNIYDEAGYYEKGWTDKTITELSEYWNDYNNMMSDLTAKLKEVFGSDNVTCGADLGGNENA
ncbi:MAG: hypothetical protein ABFD79_06215 [Phycisphaerales bacterium]